ncbi:putative membrane protein, partial [Yersinia pestis PY-58]
MHGKLIESRYSIFINYGVIL